MIKFCHIAPVDFLERYTIWNGAHLTLAHLVEQNKQYRDFYAESVYSDDRYVIMDNSAFEMFKQKKPMYESSKLIGLARQSGANCIVMSDYPREHWSITCHKAREMAPQIKDAGFDTFFVPQSELGDMDGFIRSIEWALSQDDIDIIGMSILACPIAFGVDESKNKSERSDSYKLQRFMSRYACFQEMERRGIFDEPKTIKKFHCLGMTDGPREIDLLRPYHSYIRSWDSSAAIWCGINGIRFDNSPTGLMYGKFEEEVDFDFKKPKDTVEIDGNVMYNVEYINKLISEE